VLAEAACDKIFVDHGVDHTGKEEA